MLVEKELCCEIASSVTSRPPASSILRRISSWIPFGGLEDLPIGKSSENIKIRIFPLNIKNTYIVRVYNRKHGLIKVFYYKNCFLANSKTI